MSACVRHRSAFIANQLPPLVDRSKRFPQAPGRELTHARAGMYHT